jgi:hypothetical protein
MAGTVVGLSAMCLDYLPNKEGQQTPDPIAGVQGVELATFRHTQRECGLGIHEQRGSGIG